MQAVVTVVVYDHFHLSIHFGTLLGRRFLIQVKLLLLDLLWLLLMWERLFQITYIEAGSSKQLMALGHK